MELIEKIKLLQLTSGTTIIIMYYKKIITTMTLQGILLLTKI